jgi:hypothetical protein
MGETAIERIGALSVTCESSGEVGAVCATRRFAHSPIRRFEDWYLLD